jgi:hypothetical protein
VSRDLSRSEIAFILVVVGLSFAALAAGHEQWVDTAIVVSLVVSFLVWPLLQALGHRGREEPARQDGHGQETTGGSDVATERARRVVAMAEEEAQALGSHYIGTEHLLLGLLREERGRAAEMLRRFGLTTERVRTQITRTVGQSEGAPAAQPRLTPAARRTFARATGALSLQGDELVDTEHVLLGLVQDGEGLAARVMGELDVDPGEVRRQAILALHERTACDPLRPHPLSPTALR